MCKLSLWIAVKLEGWLEKTSLIDLITGYSLYYIWFSLGGQWWVRSWWSRRRSLLDIQALKRTTGHLEWSRFCVFSQTDVDNDVDNDAYTELDLCVESLEMLSIDIKLLSHIFRVTLRLNSIGLLMASDNLLLRLPAVRSRWKSPFQSYQHSLQDLPHF